MDELQSINADLKVWAIAPPDFDSLEVRTMRERIDAVIANFFGTASTIYTNGDYSRLIDPREFSAAKSDDEKQRFFEDCLLKARMQIERLLLTLDESTDYAQ